jgi:pyruvate dehydrogenase E2 component (dihydrolipoamide acetyltransferase)
MGDFVMPSLGADMEFGTLLEWRVREGDTVHHGDIVAVVDTEKSTIEVEVFDDGVVTELLVEPGEEVPVGTALARIGPPSAEAPAEPVTAEAPGAAVAAEAPPEPVTAAPMTTTAAPATRPPRRRTPRKQAARPRRGAVGPVHVRASPLARRRAAEKGLDLGGLDGSGPGGAVVAADVDRAAGKAPAPRRGRRTTPARPAAPAPPAAGAPPGDGDRQDAMRRATGALMARSKREIPHYYLATTIDLATALSWLRDANDRRPVTGRLLPGALLLKATALAARQVPALNGFWDDGYLPSAAVHLGVAVSLRGGGLVAPAVHDADRLTLDELMAAVRDLVARARAGTLRSSEVTGATITVTNLGDQGVDEVHGVIHPPQVALVGFGKVAERPWASDGMLGVRPTVRATVAADHRASDGLVGARFLTVIDRLLHTPEDL